MKRLFLAVLAASTVYAAPADAQDTRAQVDSLRAEAVRSRGFIRGAETQLSKVIAWADSILASLDPGTPNPEPTPDPAPDPPPPSGELVFESDWGDGDVGDGGRWDRLDTSRFDVVPGSWRPGAPGGDWLRTRYTHAGGDSNLVVEIQDLGIGDLDSFTVEVDYIISCNGPTSQSHYDTADVFAYRYLTWHTPETRPYGDGQYRPTIRAEGATSPYPYNAWIADPGLPQNQVIHHRIRIEKVALENGELSFRVWPEHYVGGELVLDANSYHPKDWPGVVPEFESLQAWYDAGNHFVGPVDAFRRLGIGNNGATQGQADPDGFWAYSNFRVLRG